MTITMGTGAFFLALALIVNAVAFLVPYWIEVASSSGIAQNGKGLWGECSCTWYLNDIVNHFKTNPDWLQAVQAMYAIAMALIIISVLLLMFSSCCREKQGGKGVLVSGVFLIIAFALIAASIIVFGFFANRSVNHGNPGLTGNIHLGWGMWLGVAGAVICLLAGIMHIHWGRRRD